MRQPRVALVYDVLYPWVRGGAEKRYWEIARRLPDHGFEPHLVGPKYWEGPAAIKREGVWLHGICRPHELYTQDGTRSIGEAVGFALQLFPALLRLHVEVIDACAFPYFPWFSARAVAALRGVPILTTWPELWGPYWRSYLGPLKGSIAQGIEQATVRMTRQHLCPSPFTARRLARVTPNTPVAVLPAGIACRDLVTHAAPYQQRTGVLYVGRLIAHKRVDDLLQAMVVARKAAPSISLTIVGSGPAEPHLRRAAAALGLQDVVSFRGVLEDQQLLPLLGTARCLVLPSAREGQGMVVAEAQAMGTPPIIAYGPETAASDFVEHGTNGLLYAVGDTAALARALGAVEEDDDLHRRLALGAQEAAARLDWDRVVLPQLAALYGELLEGRRHLAAA